MDFNVLSGENTNIYEYKPSLLDDAGCENRHLAQLPTNAMCLSDVVPYENLVKKGAPLVCKTGRRYTLFGLHDIQLDTGNSMFTQILPYMQFIRLIKNNGHLDGAARTYYRID
uniref:Peptidase S1 domain-containing protein n=1 Tax=Trichuris muris TaxID=70415 RepID=A0A5S6QJ66_TRIMR